MRPAHAGPLAVAGILGALLPEAALAQSSATVGTLPSSASIETLPPMMVTATRSPEEPFDVPYAGGVIGPVEFEQKLPRTTPEALRDQPSIMLQKTAHGQGSPFIRGFTGFRTLMLIDGIRMNNSTYREGPNQYWNTVDSFSLDRLEVVRGPSSVLYGSDAIGGTVNAVPLSRDLYNPGFEWNPRAYYRYSSAENSHTGRAEVSGNQDDTIGFHVGGSFKDYGDLEGGDDVGRQRNTGYSEWDLDGNLEWILSPNTRLVFGHQTVDLDDAWRTHGTIYGVSWEGTTVGNDQARILDQFRNLDYVRFEGRNLDGFIDAFQATASYHVQNEQELRVRNNGRREEQTVDVGTLGISLQAESETPIGNWIYGTEYYHDWVDSSYERYSAAGNFELRRLQGPVADDSGYDLFGVYAEDHIPFGQDRWEFILGGRFNMAHADAGKVEDPATGAPLSFDESWYNAAGSGRLLWHVDSDNHWNVFAGASQGFRAPNLSDLTRFDIARSGEQEIPTLDLDPEHFVSFEIGAKARYGRFGAEASLYHTLIDDMITRVPTGATTPGGLTVVSKQNSGSGDITGVELEASVEVADGLTLWGNFSWMEGRLDTPIDAAGTTQTEPVSRLMPTTVNYGLRWEHAKRKFWAEFAGTVAAEATRLNTGDKADTQRIPPGGTPEYEVFHLRGGWRATENLTLSLAVENLTDADYRIHGSGLNEPGRNFIVAADLRF